MKNGVRNYNELTNEGIKPTEKYKFKRAIIIDDEDKDSCLRLLTFNNKHLKLCQDVYNVAYLNSVIEYSDWFLYFHNESDVESIVAFVLIKFMNKKKGKIANILLLCAIPNDKKFGQMMVNAMYHFTIQRGCKFLYVSPRTPLLRKTFLKYGFEPIYGKENVDEVLEKEIENNQLQITKHSKTYKNPRKIE